MINDWGEKRHNFQLDSSKPVSLGNAQERRALLQCANIERYRVVVQLAVVSEPCESKK